MSDLVESTVNAGILSVTLRRPNVAAPAGNGFDDMTALAFAPGPADGWTAAIDRRIGANDMLDATSSIPRRNTAVRVFGATAALLGLFLVVLLLVRPDMLTAAMHAVVAMMH